MQTWIVRLRPGIQMNCEREQTADPAEVELQPRTDFGVH